MNINHLKWYLQYGYLNLVSSINKSPIFILGNQKTGTSAIASLLGEATGLSCAIDPFCIQGDLERKLVNGELSFSGYIRKSRYHFSKQIIKEPSYTFFYKQLKANFPDAQFVFILRDPYENVRSICNRLGVKGDIQGDFTPTDSLFYDWHYIAHGEAFGHKGKNFIHTQALRIDAAYQIFKRADNMLLVQYEEFMTDKKSFINKLALELGVNPINLNIDYNKQFQPKGNTVKAKEFFSKENYGIIHSTCQEILNRYYLPCLSE